MALDLKILILSDANSIHTLKWVESIREHHANLMLFSLFKPKKDYLKRYIKLNVDVKTPDLKSKIKNIRNPNFSKLNYLIGIRQLKRIINDFQPNILHAHYASSYGVLAFISNYKPFILSVWGSDILDFPNRNFFNKWLLKKVINSASTICSTSQVMKKNICDNYNRYDIELIPFGVDINLFSPKKNHSKKFTVGTIKSIEKHNGIDCLLDAASIIVNEYHKNDIHFLIVGEGSVLEEMKLKATRLRLNDFVEFTSGVSHQEIVEYHRKLSVFIAVSTRESFGVAVLEAAACGVPAITSDIGGLPEVNENNKTGNVIKPNDPRDLANSIIKFYNNPVYRKMFGQNARDRVIAKFDWENSVKKMINIYNQYL